MKEETRPNSGIGGERAIAAWLAMAAGASGCLGVIWLSAPFLRVVPGSEIRPMGWTAAVFAVALLSFIIGVPAFFMALHGARRRLATVGLVLSLLPLPLSIAILRLSAHFVGFTLKD